MESASVRSMTGYGESERDMGPGQLRVEIRTVNNRYLNVQFRVPPGLDRHQRRLERTLKDHFVRGQVSVNVTLDRGTPGRDGVPVRVDVDRARAYVEALRALQAELNLDGRIDIGLLSRYRGVLEETDPAMAAGELSEELLLEVTNEAAQKAVRAREEEGGFLRDDLSGRLEIMEAEIDGVEGRAPERLVLERDRLREAIRELVEGNVSIDEERVSREIAHLAERWDVHEELVRFRSHMEMFRAALRDGDSGGVGKRLGFIAQELLREANTIGSKANDAEIARRVVTLKEEIERLREQIENVE